MNEATAFVRQRWTGSARAGIILGTGLGGLAALLAVTLEGFE